MKGINDNTILSSNNSLYKLGRYRGVLFSKLGCVRIQSSYPLPLCSLFFKNQIYSDKTHLLNKSDTPYGGEEEVKERTVRLLPLSLRNCSPALKASNRPL